MAVAASVPMGFTRFCFETRTPDALQHLSEALIQGSFMKRLLCPCGLQAPFSHAKSFRNHGRLTKQMLSMAVDFIVHLRNEGLERIPQFLFEPDEAAEEHVCGEDDIVQRRHG